MIKDSLMQVLIDNHIRNILEHKFDPKVIGWEISSSMEKNYAHRLLEELRTYHLLERILPELYHCINVDGGCFHNATVYEHLIASLKAAHDYPVRLQWAVLLHDIGKPLVAKQAIQNGQSHITFYSHEIVGASIAYAICKRLKFIRKDTKFIVAMVRWHMFRFPKEADDKAIKKWLFDLGKDNWEYILKLRMADRIGNAWKKDRPVITEEMKYLSDKIEEFTKAKLVLYKEDLKINHTLLKKKAIRKDVSLKEVYTNLIGLVNSDLSRNNPIWLNNYVERIYG